MDVYGFSHKPFIWSSRSIELDERLCIIWKVSAAFGHFSMIIRLIGEHTCLSVYFGIKNKVIQAVGSSSWILYSNDELLYIYIEERAGGSLITSRRFRKRGEKKGWRRKINGRCHLQKLHSTNFSTLPIPDNANFSKYVSVDLRNCDDLYFYFFLRTYSLLPYVHIFSTAEGPALYLTE